VLIVRFQFTRMIGAGGMGEVWEAKSDDLPGMRFAVKNVSLEHVRNHGVVSRFFGEARAASAIDDSPLRRHRPERSSARASLRKSQ